MADSHRCELCGSSKSLELHHIIPLVFGGPDVLDNWIALCINCHTRLTPRKLLQQRGIEKAKNNGVYKGRTPIKIDEDVFRAECQKWRSGEQTARNAMKQLGLKPNTFYRRVKEIGL